MKKIFNKKIFSILGKVIKVVLIVFIVMFISMVCLQRFSNNKVSFFNFRMFTVVSGSMAPKYNVGDVLISKKIAPSKVKVGQTISYLGNKGNFKDKVITHQVIDIELTSDGTYAFHTKGLANLVEDPIVSERQLYGVVIYKCILLSVVYKVVGTTTGLFFFVVLPILYIIGSEIIIAMLSREENRRSKM